MIHTHYMLNIITRVIEYFFQLVQSVITPSNFIILGLLAASVQDWRTSKVYNWIPAVIFTAAVIDAGMTGQTINSHIPLMLAFTLASLYLITGKYLEKKHVWAEGDTLLFTSLGASTWGGAAGYLLILAMLTIGWVKVFGKTQYYAPVFMASYLLWLL